MSRVANWTSAFQGAFTLMLTVVTLLLGVSLKVDEDLPWASPIVVGLLIAAAVGSASFILVEAKIAKEPILPMSLLLQRTPAAVGMVNLYVDYPLSVLVINCRS